jgi:hypothetical protein
VTQQTHLYRFFWSPEGRCVAEITATSLTAAKAAFRRQCPQYACYMGEVYWEVV